MIIFPKPIQKDDQARIRADIARDVRIGGKAKVSLGGMSTAVVEVTDIGRDGITVRDAKGRIYHFVWGHVIGPVGSDAKLDDAKEAASHREGQPMAKTLQAKHSHRARRVLFVKAKCRT